MSIGAVLSTLFIAQIYSFWPVVARWSGLSSAWVSIIIMVGSLFPTLFFFSKELRTESVPLSMAALIVWGIAVLNGIAVCIYSTKLTDPTIPTGIFVVSMLVMMVVLTPFNSWILNGETITVRQLWGVALALPVIYLIAFK